MLSNRYQKKSTFIKRLKMASDDNTINIVTAAFVIIGNEIISGRTKDVNLYLLAYEL
jgi:hypothetical protein